MSKVVKNSGKYQNDQEDYTASGGGGVTSFNSRTGAVTPQSGDYDTSQISTAINGIVKGNGSVLSAASSGTDYAPATSGTSILKGNGSGGFSNAASGTDYAPATSGTSVLKGNGSGGFSNAVASTDYAPATSGTGILKGNGSGGFTTGAAFADLSDSVAFTDYSGTSTIVGFTAYLSKQIQYMVIGKLCIVLYDLRSTANNGNGTTTSFTIPYNASSWAGDQVFLCRTQNATTQATGMGIIASGSNVVNFYTSTNTGTLNSWTNAATRHIQGVMLINIA